MLRITESVSIPMSEIEMTAVRSRGPGGQNVNKVASAIHLRFDIGASASLSDEVKTRLMNVRDNRISADGVVVIKAQRFRSQDKNRTDGLKRLQDFLRRSLATRKTRKKTRPGRKSIEKRLDNKSHRGQLKQSRNRPDE